MLNTCQEAICVIPLNGTTAKAEVINTPFNSFTRRCDELTVQPPALSGGVATSARTDSITNSLTVIQKLKLCRRKGREEPDKVTGEEDAGPVSGTDGQDVGFSLLEVCNAARGRLGSGKDFDLVPKLQTALVVEKDADFVSDGVLGHPFTQYNSLDVRDCDRMVVRALEVWRQAEAG